MKFDKYLMLGIFAVLVAVFLSAAYWYRNMERTEGDNRATENANLLFRSYNASLGKPDAKVTVVEFFDPECEACSAFYTPVKRILKENEGRVRLVLRYMPLHKNSYYAAAILESARKQGKYWEALEMLFERQPDWASHHAPKPELLMDYMKELGLNLEAVKSSVEDIELKSKIQQDHEDGKQLGVAGTPTFFINGKLLRQLGFEELRTAVANAATE